MKIPIFIKKIVCFVFRKRIAELKAKQIAKNYSTIIKNNLPKLKEIGVTTANCPYCNIELNKFPAKKTKCKNCLNYIYVKTRPIDNKKVLIKENEIELIEKEWENNAQINYYNTTKKTYIRLEPLTIYSYKKPEIINFINDKDYKVLLDLYSNHFYGSKYNFNTILGVYHYNVFDWNTLLEIIYFNQSYWKRKKELLTLDIKKCEVTCSWGKSCTLSTREWLTSEVPELPIVCPLNKSICRACLVPVIEFDLT